MLHPTRRTRPHGIALITVLFVIALITIMVVALLDGSRLEHAAAANHLERARALHFSQMGIERITAVLQKETVTLRLPDESDEDYTRRSRHWISQPGSLVIPEAPTTAAPNPNPKQLTRSLPLSSGLPQATGYTRSVFEPAELNIRLLSDFSSNNHLIADRAGASTTAPSLRVRWIYLREILDPSDPDYGSHVFDHDENPSLADPDRPIVGRFAYWADDESSKINYNLAWKRSGNPHTAAHPSRINLTALPLPDGHPLTEAMADLLHHWTGNQPGRYFNSFADARQADAAMPGISNPLFWNRFELTHYNHDPDTTFFGEDRIMLTTNGDLVPHTEHADGTRTYHRKFLDIRRDDERDGKTYSQRDPGILNDIAGGQPDYGSPGNPIVPNKFDAAVRLLMSYLQRSDWPIAPGASFQKKYYPGTSDGDARLGQIAVNIIDYVRAKESAQPVVAPLRYALGPADAPVGEVRNKYTIHPTYSVGTYSYQGLSRAPHITEYGIWQAPARSVPSPVPSGWPMEAGTPKPMYPVTLKWEITLPRHYGFDPSYPNPANQGIDLNPTPDGPDGWFLDQSWILNTNAYGVLYTINRHGNLVRVTPPRVGGSGHLRIHSEDVGNGSGPQGTVLPAGGRVTITKLLYLETPDPASTGMNNVVLSFRGAIYKATEDPTTGMMKTGYVERINVVPQKDAFRYRVPNANVIPLERMPSIECDDPRANVHPNDWKYYAVDNTFGAENRASTLGKEPAAIKPQQDTDAAGRISDHSLYMPPPKGVGTNGPDGDNGRVTSVGELGYIHTGNDTTLLSGGGGGSVPWRTIRLQPNNYPGVNILPDWALLDLFTVPNTDADKSDELYKPHGTAVGGRINVNSRVEPFTGMDRNLGLVALLKEARALPSTSGTVPAEVELASHVYHLTPAPVRHGSQGKTYGYANAYDTPGEICEIAGIADRGEESEDLVRDIISLVTSRGGVFGIYTVGQALKQTRTGDLVVTAEQRHHILLERYLDNRGTENPADDKVRFRAVYSRKLMP